MDHILHNLLTREFSEYIDHIFVFTYLGVFSECIDRILYNLLALEISKRMDAIVFNLLAQGSFLNELTKPLFLLTREISERMDDYSLYLVFIGC